MHLSFSHWLFWSTLVSPTLSVPLNDAATDAAAAAEYVPRAHPHRPHRDAPTGPFRRLRDAIIETIWWVPGKSPPAAHTSSTRTLPPARLRRRYGGDVVLRFQVRTEDEAKALSDTAAMLYLDIWEATPEWVDIRVAKDVLPSFIDLLPASLHEAYMPLMHDLDRAVQDTYPRASNAHHQQTLLSSLNPSHGHPLPGPPQDLFFHDYQPLSVLYPWLRLVASLFPSHATLESIGVSAEGRDIPALRLGTQADHAGGGDKHDTRQTLLIVGGNHAREWISVSTAAYVAYSLVTRYGHPDFPHVTKILNHFDVLFVPVLNPDGYEYTWTSDRLWRKNRQATSLPFCPGIDLDHAFRFGWNGHGNYDNACSDSYAGPAPLAAVEAQVLSEWARDQVDNRNVSFIAYLDLHSYSQEVLYPYSYTCDVDPPNLEDLEEVAMGIAKSFRLTNGHYYGVDSACEGDITLGSTKRTRVVAESQGGSALDFFYHDLDVKLAFQVKLRDTGTYGFLLPKENILPTGEEAYEAVVGLGRWILGNHGIESVDDAHSVWGDQHTDLQEPPGSATGAAQEGAGRSSMDEDDPDAYDDHRWDLRRRRRR